MPACPSLPPGFRHIGRCVLRAERFDTNSLRWGGPECLLARLNLGKRRIWGSVQIQSPRLLQWHWTDVGVAHCFDSSSNKILSPTIPSGISYVKTLQRTANPPPNTGEGTRQRARNDGNAPPMTARSFALTRLRRHREVFLN